MSQNNKFQHIVICGMDGVGKTTQINLLKQHYESLNYTVLLTRGIGGPVGSEIELLRNLIFQNQIKNLYMEESIFSLSEEMNLRWVDEQKHLHLDDARPCVVLQDRGMMSHIVYARSKGMSDTEIAEIYHNCIDLFSYCGTINVIMMPQDLQITLKRIEKRNNVDKEAHLKFENQVFQEKVFNFLQEELKLAFDKTNPLTSNNVYYKIVIDEMASKKETHERIKGILGL